MSTSRSHLIAAGALLATTAVAGAVARGIGSGGPAPGAEKSSATSFAAPASGRVTFTGTLDRSAVRLGDDGLTRMELLIADARDDGAARARQPTDLIVILDRSGSMTGDKIEQARAAVRELLAQLGDQDRFALVTYSDGSRTEIALAPVSDSARAQWSARLGEIAAEGGTNMSSGIDAGLALIEHARVAGRVPRAILISDGLANQGDATFDGLTNRARRAAQSEYMLSTVGVGADFNEELMTALADAGTGNYYYVQSAGDLGSVFGREFDAARTTVASGLNVRIEPASGVRVIDAAGYPLERLGDAVVFRPGALFAGQERRIWLTLAVPQHALGSYPLGRFALSYDDHGQRRELAFSETPRIACVASEGEFYAGVDVGTWGRAVVVDAYNKMQAEVAREVKAGRRDQALERVVRFKEETATMNAHLRSAPVAAQLDSAARLEAEVGAAFEGPNQPARQNFLSKSAGAAAVDARRMGAK
jgi:Ca-activated chloride channel family protein